MSFWKKWWKKKNKDKQGASEFEDLPLPSEVEADAEKARQKRRNNNLSMSRSGRMKSKSRERSQLGDDLFQQGTFTKTNPERPNPFPSGENSSFPVMDNGPLEPKGSFGKNSCREAQQQLMAQHQSMQATTIH